jgi:hypothetical protein
MPYSSRKVRGKACYRVSNTKTKKIFSKCASKKNAGKQLRLLRALHYNKKFTPYSSTIKQTRKKIKIKGKITK